MPDAGVKGVQTLEAFDTLLLEGPKALTSGFWQPNMWPECGGRL